ncbi:uncharacterized protein LOC141904337 [Tubulanus polymorphus]|uniref:uncharacterized protein LOC141904337 n=1 Tax=Tubulanus polymorphus TaxID=672921 RepID=UPI003DA24C73
MELTAATVAVRLHSMVARELDIEFDEVFYWTDSKSVLRYIANDTARYQTFVANRVNVIRDGSQVSQWRYIDTKHNPADIVSRGLQPSKSPVKDEIWFNGPEFLIKDQSDWPLDVVDRSLVDSSELKTPVAATSVVRITQPIDKLIEHYSDWWRMKRGVAWLLLFAKRLRKSAEERKLGLTKPAGATTAFLNRSVIEEAELLLVKHSQRNTFSSEHEQLKTDARVKRASQLQGLDVYLNDDMIRFGGRLERAIVPFDQKHQIVLSKTSRISLLLLENAHIANLIGTGTGRI